MRIDVTYNRSEQESFDFSEFLDKIYVFYAMI